MHSIPIHAFVSLLPIINYTGEITQIENAALTLMKRRHICRRYLPFFRHVGHLGHFSFILIYLPKERERRNKKALGLKKKLTLFEFSCLSLSPAPYLCMYISIYIYLSSYQSIFYVYARTKLFSSPPSLS